MISDIGDSGDVLYMLYKHAINNEQFIAEVMPDPKSKVYIALTYTGWIIGVMGAKAGNVRITSIVTGQSVQDIIAKRFDNPQDARDLVLMGKYKADIQILTKKLERRDKQIADLL